MPHLSMEYSAGLEHRCDPASIARAAHAAMVDAGIFPVAGIRVRMHRADLAIVADGLPENAFLAMTLCVGAGRKKALLAHFGSAKAVSRAALSDLKAVEGVSEGLAQKVYDYFHEKG